MSFSEEFIVAEEDVKKIIEALKGSSNYDFSDYSEKSFRRRIDKIFGDYKMSVPELISTIHKTPVFVEKMIRDISVNTTEFFRDPKIWHEIIDKALPSLLSRPVLNIWHPGCSAGQEVYSLLILLHEYGYTGSIRTFATDINSEMIEEAKKGRYKYRFMAEYLPNFDKVFVEKTGNKSVWEKYTDISVAKDLIAIKPHLSQHVTFTKHNLVNDGNTFGTTFDLIMCRNVLIYFNQALQDHVFNLFWNCLSEDGYMVIGLHESIMGTASKLFLKNGQIYRKNNNPLSTENDWK
ncbi:MAG: chemotaxis protein CheR, partial [Bacteroidetes bacterium HGW-Bacteroidetes-21]